MAAMRCRTVSRFSTGIERAACMTNLQLGSVRPIMYRSHQRLIITWSDEVFPRFFKFSMQSLRPS